MVGASSNAEKLLLAKHHAEYQAFNNMTIYAEEIKYKKQLSFCAKDSRLRLIARDSLSPKARKNNSNDILKELQANIKKILYEIIKKKEYMQGTMTSEVKLNVQNKKENSLNIEFPESNATEKTLENESKNTCKEFDYVEEDDNVSENILLATKTSSSKYSKSLVESPHPQNYIFKSKRLEDKKEERKWERNPSLEENHTEKLLTSGGQNISSDFILIGNSEQNSTSNNYDPNLLPPASNPEILISPLHLSTKRTNSSKLYIDS